MIRTLLTVALLLAATPASAIDAFLRSPRPQQPAFGEVEIEVEILGSETVSEVVFRVDRREVGRRSEPPWRVVVDVGYDNTSHLFEVVVRDTSGRSVEVQRQSPAVRSDEEIDLELQQLYVTVEHGSRYDLTRERSEFRILDRGRPQKLVTFERGDAPLTALLLLDTSSSMVGDRLAAAIAGARTFVSGLRELDEAQLLLFSDRRLHTSPLVRSADELPLDLAAVSARGGTALNDHLYAALRTLDERQGRRVAVVLSDGIDTDSVLTAKDVDWTAQRSQAMIYWIRLRGGREPGSFSSSWRSRSEHASELASLERVTAQSGGRVIEIGDVSETAEAFRDVLRELRSQYVLGYYPSENRDDGSWHPIEVRVPGRSRVRTRNGYIDY